MPAVDFDRQAIERRDFPIARRGYDPTAVDAHLRALAAEFEELRRASAGGGEPSLAATAASQVQSIVNAAETAAGDIERQALDGARNTREEADREAQRTREKAVKQAREHVAAVAQAASVLLERVSSMDGEVSALVEGLRAGGGRLASDLAAVETNMGELYDAASGRTAQAAAGEPSSAAGDASPEAAPVDRSPDSLAERKPATATAAAAAPPAQASEAKPPANGDLDGARLIALNMALNGESRADADRYLAENFQLADRQKLIDEVYAAIEG
jgi:DivIVA domain-containing protein